ncbi:hypothetical protein R3P38DRAFT_3259272, partial [Favolaschia claudopus]
MLVPALSTLVFLRGLSSGVQGRELTYQNPPVSSSFISGPDSFRFPLSINTAGLQNVSSRAASCASDFILCPDDTCHKCTGGGLVTCCKTGGGACCTGSVCTTPPSGQSSKCCPNNYTNCPTGACCQPGTTCCGDSCIPETEGCCLTITNNLTVSTGSCPKPV